MTFILGIIVGILLSALFVATAFYLDKTGQTPQKHLGRILEPLVPSQGYVVEPDTSEEFALSITNE